MLWRNIKLWAKRWLFHYGEDFPRLFVLLIRDMILFPFALIFFILFAPILSIIDTVKMLKEMDEKRRMDHMQ